MFVGTPDTFHSRQHMLRGAFSIQAESKYQSTPHAWAS